MLLIVVKKFIENRMGRMVRDTRQDDHRVRSLRFCKRSQQRGRGIWPTLSKPQIYDAGGASEKHRAGLSPGEERETASRRAFVLVSAVNTAWRVTPVISFFRLG